MGASSDSKKIRALKPSSDLNAEEGFLWSRLNESGMPFQELLNLVPFDEEQTLVQIKALVEKGAAVWMDSTENEAIPDSIRAEIEMDDKDPELKELSLDFRKSVLIKIQSLQNTSASPYEVLELSPRASAPEVKMKYLELSRKFHPDRFFRKPLGHYKRKLDFIFSQIQKAHSSLRNPIEREAIDRTLSHRQKTENKQSASNQASSPKKMRALGSEFEKMGKAQYLFKQAQAKEAEGEIQEAYQLLAQAIEIAPADDSFRKAHELLRPKVERSRARKLFTETLSKVEKLGANLELLKTATEIIKADPEFSEGLLLYGRLVVDLRREANYRDAKERLLRAKAKLKNDAEPCFHLARLHVLLEDGKSAEKEAEEALKRNPRHPYAKKILEKLNEERSKKR